MSAARSIPWADLRAQYVAADTHPLPSLKSFAQQHDVPYRALLRRMKREGWKRSRSGRFRREQVRRFGQQKAEAAQLAGRAARGLLALLDEAGRDPEALYVSARTAAMAIDRLASETIWLAYARAELEDLMAGRSRSAGAPTARLGWREPEYPAAGRAE